MIEHRLAKIEQMVSEILVMLTNQDPNRIEGVDMREYKKAIQALAAGDRVPLEKYMKRGGKIPVGDYER